MYKQICAIAAGAALVMSGPTAHAATVTRTFEFTATDFQVLSGPPVPAPVDPVTGSITLTFDTLTYVEDQTAGVTVNHLNLPFAGQVAFTHNPGPFGGYYLLIGVLQGGFDGANSFYTGTSDFIISMYYPLIETPALPSLAFSQAGAGSAWYANDVSVRSYDGPAVPEPATWALLIMGFGAAGVTLRRDRRLASI